MQGNHIQTVVRYTHSIKVHPPAVHVARLASLKEGEVPAKELRKVVRRSSFTSMVCVSATNMLPDTLSTRTSSRMRRKARAPASSNTYDLSPRPVC